MCSRVGGNIERHLALRRDNDGKKIEVEIVSAAVNDVMPLRERIMYPGRPDKCVQEEDHKDHARHLAARTVCTHSDDSSVETDGEVVGIVSVFLPLPDTKEGAMFRKLAVDPKWQGSGLGSTLVRAAAEVARVAGAGRLFCHVRVSANVETFYTKKLGFSRRCGPFCQYGCDDILELDLLL